MELRYQWYNPRYLAKTLHSMETLEPVDLEPFIAETRDSFEELYEGFAMAELIEKD